jgi:putative acetyltransferase
MGVLPGFQRKGIGTKLLQEGIDLSRKLGFRSIVVVGHPAYYSRFGFLPAKPKGLLLPFPAPDDSFMALELVAGSLEGIRGAVVYPPAFLHVL